MSPILVRPVREQLEHDRVIRLLQAKLKRKHEVVIEHRRGPDGPVRIGQVQMFPDLVLTSAGQGKKLKGTVEVETAESVNHLEAMAQWAHFGRARAPFHLYVPAGCVDIARRLAAENSVNVSEIWSYHTLGDQTRFTLVHRARPPKSAGPRKPRARPVAAARAAAPARAAAQKRREAEPAGGRPLPARSAGENRANQARRPRRRPRRPGPRKGSSPCRRCASPGTSVDTRTPRCPQSAPADRGTRLEFSTGFARPRASASAARRSTRRRSG